MRVLIFSKKKKDAATFIVSGPIINGSIQAIVGGTR